ncbi:hypothetical protein SLA2020_138160 [Shorea laevis]
MLLLCFPCPPLSTSLLVPDPFTETPPVSVQILLLCFPCPPLSTSLLVTDPLSSQCYPSGPRAVPIT